MSFISESYAYFICLVATSNKGFPEKEMYLYDIATEIELKGFRVEFVSTDDLKKFYKKYHPEYDENEVNVYEMAYFFIKMHRGSSFFFDEVPFIQPKKGNDISRYKCIFMKFITNLLDFDKYLTLTIVSIISVRYDTLSIE